MRHQDVSKKLASKQLESSFQAVRKQFASSKKAVSKQLASIFQLDKRQQAQTTQTTFEHIELLSAAKNFIHYLCGVLQLVQWLSYFMLGEDLQQHNNNAMTQI